MRSRPTDHLAPLLALLLALPALALRAAPPSTPSATPSPSPSPQCTFVLADFANDSLVNYWGGQFSGQANIGGSSPSWALVSLLPDGVVSAYALSVSGLAGITPSYAYATCSLLSPTAAVNLSNVSAVRFILYGQGTIMRFRMIQANVADNNQPYFDLSPPPPASWASYTVSLASLSPGSQPLDLTQALGFQWGFGTPLGSMDFQVSQVSLVYATCASLTPSPSATAVQATPTPSDTATASMTPTFSASPSPTGTGTASPTPQDTATGSITPTPSATPSSSASPTSTSTASPTESMSPSSSPTPTASAEPSGTATFTISSTLTNTPTATPTASSTPSSTGTPSLTASPSSTGTPSLTASPSSTASSTASPTASASPTITASFTASPSSTQSPTASCTPSITPTPSASAEPTGTPTATPLPKGLLVGPNPFSPYLPPHGVSFRFPARGSGELCILDLERRVRRRLYWSDADSAIWDGRDDAGQLLGGGVYVYVARARGSSWRGTVTLVR